MGQGLPCLDGIRRIGVVEQTYYRWRKRYGGIGVDQLKELKHLQQENDRLRRGVSDLTLDKLILTEAARGPVLHRKGSPHPDLSSPGQAWEIITSRIELSASSPETDMSQPLAFKALYQDDV